MNPTRGFVLSFIAFTIGMPACENADGGFGGKPLLWPNDVCPGATVAVSIDSNYIPLADELEIYDLSRENVSILIDDDSPGGREITPKAVIGGATVASSTFAKLNPGAWLSIAVFDIPTDLVVDTYPTTTTIRLLKDGVDMWTDIPELPQLRIRDCDPAAQPTAFWNLVLPNLEPQPMLRLRAKRCSADCSSPSADGFDPTWQIGSLEFEVEFDPARVTSPQAFPTSEAIRATAIVGPGSTASRARVLVVAVSRSRFPQ